MNTQKTDSITQRLTDAADQRLDEELKFLFQPLNEALSAICGRIRVRGVCDAKEGSSLSFESFAYAHDLLDSLRLALREERLEENRDKAISDFVKRVEELSTSVEELQQAVQ